MKVTHKCLEVEELELVCVYNKVKKRGRFEPCGGKKNVVENGGPA